MPCLDLGMLALGSISFDCCQHLFQGQVSSIEVQLQHAVHGYTALECGKNVNVCLCLILLVWSLKREQKEPLRFHQFCFALNWSRRGIPQYCFQCLVYSGFKYSSNGCSITVPKSQFQTRLFNRRLVLQTLWMSSPEWHWAHELDTCTDVQLHFPCVHPYTLQALEAVPISFGAFF